MTKTSPRLFGVLGSHILYTLSPEIFRILFKEYSLPHAYLRFDIESGDLGRFVRSSALFGVDGFNVTIPFKQRIIRFLHRLDKDARDCGAVNLICMKDNRLSGYNTDIFAIDNVFRENQVDVSSCDRILLLGAGGTGKTALGYFLKKKTRRIDVANRGRERLNKMILGLPPNSRGNRIHAFSLQRMRRTLRSEHYDIIFNATPIATRDLLEQDTSAVADSIYEAAYPTRGVGKQNIGLIGGLDMLVYQALRSFEILTGVTIADYSEIKRLVLGKLKSKRYS